MQLRDAFIGHFQGTYAQLGIACELRRCRQKKGESLSDYIRCFSKHCAEHPDTTDNWVITGFQDGTTCETLVHQIG
jgi:hypothetical protein